MISIDINNLTIGVGRPKICAPITATTLKDIREEATYIYEELNSAVDIVEYRADYFKGNILSDVDKILELLKQTLKEIPILFTFRTLKEGGECEISIEDYEKLIDIAIESNKIELIDVEMMRSDDLLIRTVKKAHEKNVYVVASNHEFGMTPSKDEIVSRLMKMSNLGADIPKIAVMPKDREDVLTLLSATSIAKTCIDNPIITISMGKMGAISRMSGAIFGSAVTFGTAKKSSAPGQIDVKKLKEILELVQC